MSSRRAYTVAELLIALALACVISGVLTFTYVSISKQSEAGLAILDLLRKSTLLLGHLKRDLRVAGAEPLAVEPQPDGVSIRRVGRDGPVTVRYTHDPVKFRVTRDATDARSETYGVDGVSGLIVAFSVRSIAAMPGFYGVDVVCAKSALEARALADARARDPKTVSPYEFHALVNKRAVDPAAGDLRWNAAFAR